VAWPRPTPGRSTADPAGPHADADAEVSCPGHPVICLPWFRLLPPGGLAGWQGWAKPAQQPRCRDNWRAWRSCYPP
jgi:hypothetical protein